MGLVKCNNAFPILGDAAYPLWMWLLTPYRDNGHLSPQQMKYNYYHSTNRMVIERFVALLKSRFRRLHMIDTHSVRKACEIIMTCCILHNVCIMENDVVDDDLADEGCNDNKANMCQETKFNAEGVLKRDRIAQNRV